jgi:hypothetical protein
VGHLGRREGIRALNIVDDFTRECRAIEVDTSPPSLRVARVLERLPEEQGPAQTIGIDLALYVKAERWSRRSDLNRGPADYESAALPLSYAGVGRGRFRRNRRARIVAESAAHRHLECRSQTRHSEGRRRDVSRGISVSEGGLRTLVARHELSSSVTEGRLDPGGPGVTSIQCVVALDVQTTISGGSDENGPARAEIPCNDRQLNGYCSSITGE